MEASSLDDITLYMRCANLLHFSFIRMNSALLFPCENVISPRVLCALEQDLASIGTCRWFSLSCNIMFAVGSFYIAFPSMSKSHRI
jgi:hypothetical protein